MKNFHGKIVNNKNKIILSRVIEGQAQRRHGNHHLSISMERCQYLIDESNFLKLLFKAFLNLLPINR